MVIRAAQSFLGKFTSKSILAYSCFGLSVYDTKASQYILSPFFIRVYSYIPMLAMSRPENNILTQGEETSGWPWGYGTFAIITPVITVPLLLILYRNQRKALRDGLLVKEKSGRTLWQNVNFFFWEFDGQSTLRTT